MVLDWRGREGELTQLANPFAQALLAQLAVITSRGEIEVPAATWLALIRRLVSSGYTDEQISAKMTFLDGVIALPEEIEARVEAELVESEGIGVPEVMSRWEARIWQRAQEPGQQSLSLMLLEQQSGSLPDDVAAQVRDLSSGQFAELGLALPRFSQLADLTTRLSENATATH